MVLPSALMAATRARLQPAGVVAQDACGSASAAEPTARTDVSSWSELLEEEFARLAQRELDAQERAVAEAALQGVDAWVSGHDPEALPTLAVALGTAWIRATGAKRPLLFLSPERELLRSRQVRFGARAKTVLIDGGRTSEERDLSSDKTSGAVLWCSLESLRDPHVKRRLAELEPAVICVESAHAASPWAHEIRPSLALVPALRAASGHPPVLAITRGVPEHVRLDASARLGLAAPRLLRAPLAVTTDLRVEVLRTGQRATGEVLLESIERLPRPTIVFCSTPREADAAYAELSAAQVPVHRYHGGMSVTERATEILHFTLPGRRAVMVATSAFAPSCGLAGVDGAGAATPEGLGLGYCKQKARSLVHLTPPVSLEQYALELSLLSQEEPTESVLFVGAEHLRDRGAFLDEERIRAEHVEVLSEVLAEASGDQEVAELERLAGLGRRRTGRALALLEDAGVLEVRLPGVGQTSPREVRRVVCLAAPAALLQVAQLLSAELRQMQEGDGLRLAGLRRFLETGTCHRAAFESYWSDVPETACGLCAACRSGAGTRSAGAAAGEGSSARRRASGAPEAPRPVVQRRAQARAWSAGATGEPGPALGGEGVVVQKVPRTRRTLVS